MSPIHSCDSDKAANYCCLPPPGSMSVLAPPWTWVLWLQKRYGVHCTLCFRMLSIGLHLSCSEEAHLAHDRRHQSHRPQPASGPFWQVVQWEQRAESYSIISCVPSELIPQSKRWAGHGQPRPQICKQNNCLGWPYVTNAYCRVFVQHQSVTGGSRRKKEQHLLSP